MSWKLLSRMRISAKYIMRSILGKGEQRERKQLCQRLGMQLPGQNLPQNRNRAEETSWLPAALHAVPHNWSKHSLFNSVSGSSLNSFYPYFDTLHTVDIVCLQYHWFNGILSVCKEIQKGRTTEKTRLQLQLISCGLKSPFSTRSMKLLAWSTQSEFGLSDKMHHKASCETWKKMVRQQETRKWN